MSTAAELYMTPGSIWVFVCVGARLTFALMIHLPCGLLTMRSVGCLAGVGGRKKINKTQRGETGGQMGRARTRWIGRLVELTGRCLWAIIYKLFNLGYFLALGSGKGHGSRCQDPSTSPHPSQPPRHTGVRAAGWDRGRQTGGGGGVKIEEAEDN